MTDTTATLTTADAALIATARSHARRAADIVAAVVDQVEEPARSALVEAVEHIAVVLCLPREPQTAAHGCESWSCR
ncbi:hypothetical protein [Leekyejoonella antrihumi]|uniref:Uncharacterized protein n=1 Tax=Leekyejoonella antrihumi TaxID=1660198 RepID=A0A563E6X1_9MICO|nr:hypothetical protein [Leekyejoonella antrihumi]TWP37961.1 hypothetical protein FGL98_04425 [Leekyejoonella antrihumi]